MGKLAGIIRLFILLFIAVSSTTNQYAQSLTDSLQGHYKLNGSLVDLSPNNIDGIADGDLIATEGIEEIENTGFLFNGINSRINLSNDSRNITDQFTISAWVKTESAKRQFAICKYDSREDRGYFIAVDDGKATLGGRDESDIFWQVDSDIVINDGEWHFLLGYYQNNTWSLIVDCETLTTESNTDPSNIILNSSAELMIGMWPEGEAYGTPRYFDGIIDNVRIYNRALELSEILLLCNNKPVDTNDTALDNVVLRYSSTIQAFELSEFNTTENLQFIISDMNGRTLRSGIAKNKIYFKPQIEGIYIFTIIEKEKKALQKRFFILNQ